MAEVLNAPGYSLKSNFKVIWVDHKLVARRSFGCVTAALNILLSVYDIYFLITIIKRNTLERQHVNG